MGVGIFDAHGPDPQKFLRRFFQKAAPFQTNPSKSCIHFSLALDFPLLDDVQAKSLKSDDVALVV